SIRPHLRNYFPGKATALPTFLVAIAVAGLAVHPEDSCLSTGSNFEHRPRPALHLVLRYVFDVGRDRPSVAVGIADFRHPIAVEHVGGFHLAREPGIHGTSVD